MRQELKELNALNEQDLYDRYIKPGLVPFEIENLETNSTEKDKLMKYKKFQLEKALSLIEDVIERGHTGNQYLFTFNVDAPDTNGMTAREMLAISYTASKDLEKLVRAGNNYQDLNEKDKTICALEAKMKFFEGLYLIRRGYNVDHETDDRDKMTFKREAVDENVCQGGTVNRLGDALNGMHRDVEIRIFNVEQIKKRIQNISLDTIKAHIVQNNSDIKTAMQLREWKANGTMPKELQSLILKELKKTITSEHDLVKEFGKDFSHDELVGNIAQQAMASFKFPKEKIIVNTEKEVDILGYYMEHVYSVDEKGKTALNIDLEIGRNPEFIKELLDKDFNLSQIYVPRNGKMLHIASDYLRHFDDIPDKLITYIIEDLYSYKEVYMEMEASKQKILLENSKPLIQALAVQNFGERIREFIKLFPEEKRIEPAKAAISVFAEKGDDFQLKQLIKLFPKEDRIELIGITKAAMTHFVENGKAYLFNDIIELFPEEERVEFIDIAKQAITIFIEYEHFAFVKNLISMYPKEKRMEIANQAITDFGKNGNAYHVSEIIQLFPEEERKEFLDSAKQAITAFVENKDASRISEIISIYPEEKRMELMKFAVIKCVEKAFSQKEIDFVLSSASPKELMKFAVIKCLEKDCSEKEIDLVLDSVSPELKLNIIKEVMNEQGFKPSLSKHLPWVDWGRGVMKELTKYMVDGMSNVEPQSTPNTKIKPSGKAK